MQSGFGELLTQGIGSADLRVRRMCKGIDYLWPTLWTYLDVPGVEPTNNVAERAIRPAVLWRKGSFGTQSGVTVHGVSWERATGDWSCHVRGSLGSG